MPLDGMVADGRVFTTRRRRRAGRAAPAWNRQQNQSFGHLIHHRVGARGEREVSDRTREAAGRVR